LELKTVDKIEISFFVPCFNEEKNVVNTLNNIVQSIKDINYEILVCDDGSTDSTKEQVVNFNNSSDANITFIENKKNYGIGFSYFKHALKAKGKYYILINGDNVEPVETIKKIINLKGSADMIIPYFGANDKRTLKRRIISIFFSSIINLITFTNIKYFNGPVLHKTENVQLYKSNTYGYGYQAELICNLLLHNKTYKQVEVLNSDRQWGNSKAFNVLNILSVSHSILNIFINKFTNTIYSIFFNKK